MVLHDSVPAPFQTYHVHDGRVTFVVPEEFELDLSIAEEDNRSQYFFVDIRFLFTPSSRIPKGRVFDEVDLKINNVLRDSGLHGCFDFLHNLVLTVKINIMFKQAIELARGLWSGALRVELIHRTLILQYWTSRPERKSWLEIGVKSGRQKKALFRVPYLALRWINDGGEVDSENILFNTEKISVESILRSVIALHISRILSTTYTKLNEMGLFANRALSLRAELSRVEPGDCHLDIQLTASRSVRVSIEPMSGIGIVLGAHSVLERSESERSMERPLADDIVARVSRLRCMAAMEEIETNVNMLGLETASPRLKSDPRKVFSSKVLRFSFFRHRLWDRRWFAAATSSMDGDSWWTVNLTLSDNSAVSDANATQTAPFVGWLQVVSRTFLAPRRQLDYSLFSDLGHCLSGIIAIHANACFVAGLQCVRFHPSVQALQLKSNLKEPDLFFRYEAKELPTSLQMALPAGFKKKSFVKEKIRLTFAGTDPSSKLAVMIAYGQLVIPAKTLRSSLSRLDHFLVFQPTGNGFAIRLLAPVGQSVIVDLLERLQKLECALSILETLQRKRMLVQTLSLSRIAFAYGPDGTLSGGVSMEVLRRSQQSSPKLEPDDLLSRANPLFRLYLGFYFNRPNPHCRFQESIPPVLNNSYTEFSLESVLDILSFTLPLFRALDRITANQSRKEPLKVQVTVRNVKTFIISYPSQKCRLHLTVGRYPDRVNCVLRDVSDTQARPNDGHVATRLKQMIYNTRGDGWKGLGNGAVAELGGIENLISTLDGCFSSPGPGG